MGRPRRGGGGRKAGPRADPGPDSGADPDADPETVARTIVLRKLAAQARTRSELREALAARDVPPTAAETVLDRMAAVGLVDDARFARDWVSSRQVRRTLSRAALRRELAGKGVDRAVVDEALAETATTDERGLARDLALRKLRTMTGIGREVKMRRLAGLLGRRGFAPAVVAGVVTEVLQGEGDDGDGAEN